MTSEQSIDLPNAVVAHSQEGGRRLGSAYWQEVERFTRHLVRARPRSTGLDLCVLGLGPPLLRFGPPEVAVSHRSVECAHRIEGGVLARASGGRIRFVQRLKPAPSLSSTIDDFRPRLAAPPARPAWTGALYAHVQARLHVAISRRYFLRLVREAA